MTHFPTELSGKPRLKQGWHGSQGHTLPSPAHTALTSTSAAQIIPADLLHHLLPRLSLLLRSDGYLPRLSAATQYKPFPIYNPHRKPLAFP